MAKKSDFTILGNFSIQVNDRKAKKSLSFSIKEDCSHVRNMVLILREQLFSSRKTNQTFENLYQSFKDIEILRETVYSRKGKAKKAQKIRELNQYFKNNNIFIALQKYAKRTLDAKTFHSILTTINANFSTYKTHVGKYYDNKEAYFKEMGTKGIPKIPKPKKLKNIYHASINVDKCRWNFKTITKKVKKEKIKHEVLSIRVGVKRLYIPINSTNFPIPKDCQIRNLNVVYSNGNIYLNFGYGKPNKQIAAEKLVSKPKRIKKELIASGDLGLINVLSIFINDKNDNSFIFNGKRFIKYNCKYNKFIAKLNKDIAKNAIKWKEIKTKDEETIKIPLEYNDRGLYLMDFKRFLTEKRNKFFKEEFEKLSTSLVKYLDKINVTEFIISKNLSFLKNKCHEEKNKLNKKTQQKFYQIPLGSFLNMIERKCKNEGIKITDIDEAHTSKTSCLSADVNEMVKLRKEREKSLSTNDYKGSRVKRGLFKDKKYGIKIHADINGAINHIKVAYKEISFEWLLDYKRKLCNPRVFKSDIDFRQQLLC